ncbi:hypothetical protein DPMN_143947 [Dreissena polymorpha]|uniref:Uncharacterized protein n=1 Tax=Dreissena polymorpha TaxID=45954 RepID=A0A9D4GDZ7_DREPO|nr:hypothetical protein DPMN_143947 [Dreissena polymorpha]
MYCFVKYILELIKNNRIQVPSFEKSGQTQLGIDGCRCGNAAYLIVVIEVIGVFKASTLYVSGVPCSSGSGGNISGCIVAYTRWRVFSRVRVAV